MASADKIAVPRNAGRASPAFALHQGAQTVTQNVRPTASKSVDPHPWRRSAQVSTVGFCRHERALTTQYRGRRGTGGTAICLLQIGDLRIDDNPALRACMRFCRALPLCVIDPRDRRRDAAVACAQDLRASLRNIGSDLIIELSPNPGAVVRMHQSCIVGDTSVFANLLPGGHMDLRVQGVAVHVLPAQRPPQPPLSAPTRMPPVPATVRRPSVPQVHRWRRVVETRALQRLRCTLMYPQTAAEVLARASGTSQVRALFVDELQLGSISIARLDHEVRDAPRLSAQRPSHGRRFAPAPGSSLAVGGGATMASVAAFDIKGSKRRSIAWDEETGQLYLSNSNSGDELAKWIDHKYHALLRLFLPEDVTPDYYAFTALRFVQRCISATVTVLGTQALIIGLGLKSGANNQAAAIAWVLKNGLGRVGKMLWAGTMGRDFDVDPKRWRFHSAIMYTLGNGMEILTQIFPSSFLFFATMAITFKQVSWLTATATRNAMYRSFGYKRDNIGDITAKGEAQIVIAELIGMSLGILLSKVIGTRKRNVIAAYCLLSLLDIGAIYQEIRVIVFRTLNPQRTGLVVDEFATEGRIPSPYEISQRERIMTQPLIGADGVTFGGLLDVADTRDELARYFEIFEKENFIIGCKQKKGKKCHGKQCKIVLNEGIRSKDVLRSMLALSYLRHVKEVTFDTIADAHARSKEEFTAFCERAQAAGWNLDQLLYGTLRKRCKW